jgi:hypothetical protein
MKRNLDKVLFRLLTLFLVLTLLPAGMTKARAAEISVIDAAELTAALSTAGSGDTIILAANIDYNQGIVIDGKSITFDVGTFALNVVNGSGIGLEVINGGSAAVTGTGTFNVTGVGKGVYANGANAMINVTSATATGDFGFGVHAYDGGHVIINEDAQGDFGATSQGSGSEVIINGNAIGTERTGAWSEAGGNIIVKGNATGIIFGADAQGAGSTVTVEGNATATGSTISAGVSANAGGMAVVKGDVTGSTIGAYASGGGNVIIDGIITAPIYVRVGLDDKLLTIR